MKKSTRVLLWFVALVVAIGLCTQAKSLAEALFLGDRQPPLPRGEAHKVASRMATVESAIYGGTSVVAVTFLSVLFGRGRKENPPE